MEKIIQEKDAKKIKEIKIIPEQLEDKNLNKKGFYKKLKQEEELKQKFPELEKLKPVSIEETKSICVLFKVDESKEKRPKIGGYNLYLGWGIIIGKEINDIKYAGKKYKPELDKNRKIFIIWGVFTGWIGAGVKKGIKYKTLKEYVAAVKTWEKISSKKIFEREPISSDEDESDKKEVDKIIDGIKKNNFTLLIEKIKEKKSIFDTIKSDLEEYKGLYEEFKKLLEKNNKKGKDTGEKDMNEVSNKSSISPLFSILCSIQTKPFLILAGISGTGKTQIAILIAAKWEKNFEESIKAIKKHVDEETLILKNKSSEKEENKDAIKDNLKVAFLPVRPDWNEPKKMWGYYNPLTGLFYPTDGLRIFLNAFRDFVTNKDKDKKYFIILDEMNLARVEYYMSDLLSLMENMWSCKNNGKLIRGETAQIHPYLDACVLSNPIANKDEKRGAYVCPYANNKEKCEKCPYYPLLHPESKNWQPQNYEPIEGDPIPPRIAYPENLVIMGTVNVDETTFSFSPKVLDRAFVVEFNEVYVEEYFKTQNIKNEDFKKFVMVLNSILKPATLHFGYRTIKEMKEYLEKQNEENSASNQSLDFLLKSKILPKVHGTGEIIENVLKKLFLYCKEKDNDKINLENVNIEGELKNISQNKPWYEDTTNFQLKESAKKIQEMYKKYNSTGYVSYF